MNLTSDYISNLKNLDEILHIKDSYDLIRKDFILGDKKVSFYFIDGFLKDTSLKSLINSLSVYKSDNVSESFSAKHILDTCITAVESSVEVDVYKILLAILSGQTAMIIEDIKGCILMDFRTYPARSTEEPDKEKVIRGARDGFVETIVSNSALIRRRIRDVNLRIKMINVGKDSKTDVAICYMDNMVSKKVLKTLMNKINSINLNSLTLGSHTLVQYFNNKDWFNPMPKIRYTERPDVAASHIMEGRIALIVDNSPTVILLPTSIFDFLQDVDDYYSPILTGNYLRIIRTSILILTLFISPIFLLLVEYKDTLPYYLNFLLPTDTIHVPLVLQFIILELAIDILRTASLNTPSSLGMSLSVIGAIILGEYAVSSGWFIPQTVFYMSIIAIASFTQTNIELEYAFKFYRIILLILTSLFGIWGLVIGTILLFIMTAKTKTITEEPYLYPLIPFNWKVLRNVFFRASINK